VDVNSAQLVTWLGLAGLGLGWASLQIWRTRRSLNQVSRSGEVREHNAMTSASGESTGRIMAQ